MKCASEKRFQQGDGQITSATGACCSTGASATIFNKNIDDCENILARSKEGLDIVFNMVRFSDSAGNADLGTTVKPIGRDEERLRKLFLDE
jgi:hypothetical protein